MRNSPNAFFLLFLAGALAFLALSSAFVVHQTEQALVLRFGEPIAGRGLITDPGLHYKLPFIERVIYLDKRILDLETPRQEVLAADNQRIEVDAFVRYRISDPLKFYQTVGSIAGAQNQLGSLVNSSTRLVLGEATLAQIVRDERPVLMIKIRDHVNKEGGRFGVAVTDLRIRRADLPREISEKVYSRMQTERAREASEYRAQGSEQAQGIIAKADRAVVVLMAEAQRKADQIRGEGEAERNRIFAEAFGQDPNFFSFYRSMKAYENSLANKGTHMVLSAQSEFFHYFQGSFAERSMEPVKAP